MSRRSAAFIVLLSIMSLLPGAPPERPDLIVDSDALSDTWTVGLRFFPPDSCTLNEGCVDAPGLRTLLAFSTQTANISQVPMTMGDPNGSNLFHFDTCHQHYHFEDYADYQLLDLQGGAVAPGHKQSFCLIDTNQYLFEPWVPAAPSHSCDFQGIQEGWSDIYDSTTDCQWIDVTGVPVGDYELSVSVNPRRIIHESEYGNNTSTIPISIPDLSGLPDLILDQTLMESTSTLEKRLVPPGDPGLAEGCIGAPGWRRFIDPEVRAINVSPFDFLVGEPGVSPFYQLVSAHSHYHLDGLVEFRLLDSQNAVIASGTTPRWFPADSFPALSESWVRPALFYFLEVTFGNPLLGGNTGLQRGWASNRAREGLCEWLDVTDVPDGMYTFSATVNPAGLFVESDLTNNTASFEVEVADPEGWIAHRPDGDRVPGEPLDVLGIFDDGEIQATRISYDVSFCPATRYNLYYSLDPPSAGTYSGAVCDVGNLGNPLIQLPDPDPGELLWLVIIGAEGTREGGHGFDSNGVERPFSGVGFCGITETVPATSCRTP